MADAHLLPDRILFGAAFYDEYRVNGDLERDLDLMAEASFSVIRVGESVWATWEPEPGVYDLDWLQPVLDGAHARGISVVLGTPTYAVPPWLRAMDPDLAGEVRHRGAPARGESARRSTSRIPCSGSTPRASSGRSSRGTPTTPRSSATRSTTSPAPFLLHNQRVFDGFLRWLEGRYGDVETLNREWGLTFWSHRIRSWAELWRPDGNHSPQYQLEWRRYQAELVTDFIAWQAGIVREYADPQPVRDDLHLVRARADQRRAARAGAGRHGGQPVLPDAGGAPHRGRGAADRAVAHDRRVGALRAGRPHVQFGTGAVPGHRDERPVHRAVPLGAPHAVPGSDRARGPRPRGPRRPDDRVLAVADAALRSRDLLGRGAAAQWQAGSHLP